MSAKIMNVHIFDLRICPIAAAHLYATKTVILLLVRITD